MTASGVPFDASRPHVARVYDYLLGGKDNFGADRAFRAPVPLVPQCPMAIWMIRTMTRIIAIAM